MRLRLLYAALVVTLATAVLSGCTPRSCGAEPLPQTTLALPQTTLAAAPSDCGCGSGAACSCAAGTCNCPGNRNCPNRKQDGICPDATVAARSAAQYGCPMIEFRNQPARTVFGAVSYRYDGKQDTAPAVHCYAPSGHSAVLPADATESEILTALNPGRPVVGHTKVCTETGCRLVPQFGEPVSAGYYSVPVAYFGGRANGPCGPNG